LCVCKQSFNEYFSAEHGRLLSLWRSVVAFRRQFSEMKAATERDLSNIRADVTRAARGMHSACLNLTANLKQQESQAQVLQHGHFSGALCCILSSFICCFYL
jgi:phage-related minor tail protein